VRLKQVSTWSGLRVCEPSIGNYAEELDDVLVYSRGLWKKKQECAIEAGKDLSEIRVRCRLEDMKSCLKEHAGCLIRGGREKRAQIVIEAGRHVFKACGVYEHLIGDDPEEFGGMPVHSRCHGGLKKKEQKKEKNEQCTMEAGEI
jgi:hypothetical protein